MQYNSIHILSTRPLDQSLIKKAAEKNIAVHVESLISIEPVTDHLLKIKIAELAVQHATVAFTSINAVKAVAACLQSKPAWNIFTIGAATKDYISRHFGADNIAGTAENASSLADTIIAEQVKELIFFCGNRRRDELPEKLATANVHVQEIVVYNAVYSASKAGMLYDGILFFSPGAVQSFFTVNTIAQSTVLFAVGATTAQSIGAYCNNPVLVSAFPAADALVEKAIIHFANTNTFHEGTKE